MQTQMSQMKTLRARDIMTERVKSLQPDTPTPRAIHELLKRQFSEMPIVNADGESTAGRADNEPPGPLSAAVNFYQANNFKNDDFA